MTKLTRVDVNGVTLAGTDIISWYVDQTGSDSMDAFKLVLTPSAKTTLGSEFQNYMSVEIWEGYASSTETKVMDGVITNVNDEINKITITGVDNMVKMALEQVNKVYVSDTDSTGGIISEIVKDLITESGLSYTSGTIQDSTSEQVELYKLFVCRNAEPLERAMHLAQTLNWKLYYKSSDQLMYFEPKGFTTNSNIIFIGGANNKVVSPPKWNYDGKDMFNYLSIEGALEIFEQPPQQFDGDGSETDFTLSGQNAEFVKVEYDSAGGTSYTVQTGGKVDSTDPYDYTFNKETNTATFETAPNSGTNNVQVTPFVGVPTPVIIDDPASIATYGEKIKKHITLTDVRSVQDAEIRGRKILDAYKEEFLNTTVHVTPDVIRANAFESGQIVQVNDSINTKVGTRQMYIRRVRRFYPEQNLEVELGNQEWITRDSEYDILMRVKRLEEIQAGDQDVVTILKRPNVAVTVSVTNIFMQVWYVCDTFWTNHPINGLLNQGVTLDSFETNPTSNWTGSGVSLAENTTDPVHLSKWLACTWAGTGTHTVTSTQSFGDVSTYTGVSSGAPSKGTCGLWLYVSAAGDIDSVALRIGSSASDYIECNAKVYNSSLNYDDIDFTLSAGNNYLVFDLDNPDSTSGTPDWTAVDYAQVRLTTSESSGTAKLDFFSISKSNYIGFNPTSATEYQRMIKKVEVDQNL